jgi:DNA-binding CsgD family transcriptional regulator
VLASVPGGKACKALLRYEPMTRPANAQPGPADADARAGPSPAIRLSPRQLEVLALIDNGLTDAEAGAELGISPRTVRMHADVLRAKLGVARRRQLAAAYRRLRSLGCIEPPTDVGPRSP